MVEGVIENIVDSSYLQGVTNILDRYGRRKGVLQRQLTSLVPYSGFWRSINRASEVVLKGSAYHSDTRSFFGSMAQVIPGLSENPKLNVWGEDIKIEGGVFRQWLPYKWSKETDDPVEKELDRLGYYPGLPRQTINIKKGNTTEKVKLPDALYRDYCVYFGNLAKKRLTQKIADPNFQKLPDEVKLRLIDKDLDNTRRNALIKVKQELR